MHDMVPVVEMHMLCSDSLG